MRTLGRTGSRSLLGVLALVALGLGGGCDSAGPPVPTTITISPVNVVLQDAGRTVQLTATVNDQNGQAMAAVEVDWSSSNRITASVSEDGLVAGGASGTATVMASVDTLRAAATITVEPGPRAVLHTIYREMGGAGWDNNTSWLTDAPLDMWYGVYTNTLGHVIRLQLSHSGLTGRIPPELGKLRTLEFVFFSENRVTGSIPPELGNLPNLKALGIGSNELTGSIPPELGNLQNLEGLDLSGNELTGSIPPELGNLQILWDLDLSGNELTGSIPPELGNLQRLFEFDLSDNELTGSIPPELANPRNGNAFGPWYIDLSLNRLTGSIPSELGNLRNTRYLDLSKNKLTGSIPFQLGNLLSLRQLDLSENELTGSIPYQLGNLLSLWDLYLFGNELTGSIPVGLARIRTLTGLSIFGNPLNGSLPRDLIGVPLGLFHWHETDLCAPTDNAFREWLDSIDDHLGNGDCDSSSPRTQPPA